LLLILDVFIVYYKARLLLGLEACASLRRIIGIAATVETGRAYELVRDEDVDDENDEEGNENGEEDVDGEEKVEQDVDAEEAGDVVQLVRSVVTNVVKRKNA
jgi:hypothetical protein